MTFRSLFLFFRFLFSFFLHFFYTIFYFLFIFIFFIFLFFVRTGDVVVDTYDLESSFPALINIDGVKVKDTKKVRLGKDCGKRNEEPHLSLRLGKKTRKKELLIARKQTNF